MCEEIINEWLSECEGLSSLELSTFATNLAQDEEIVQALYLLLEERTKYHELVETVCNQLFNFYRSRETQLQRFSLQFLPTLIFIYLNAAAHGDIKNCRHVETLLVGVYNLELVDKNGEPKAVSFRLPSLAMMSIYHEPSSLAPASLTESAVRRFEECNTKLVSWGPLKHVETLNAQNRLKVMTALLFVYNQELGFLKKSALEQLCKVSSKLITQGFMKPGHHQRTSYGSDSSFIPRLLPRIPVSNEFLLELLHGIHFSMYNNCWYAALQAAEDIHHRACWESYADVMLVTNAIRNASTSGPPGQSAEGTIGVSVSSTSTTSMVKSMITNASFRTKKLPDDLDANLFETGEIPKSENIDDPQPSSSQSPKQPRTPVNIMKRRAWLWKNPMHNSFDDADIINADKHQIPGIVAPPSSVENSRRESLCSSQSSPNRSSPKKNREPKSKKDSGKSRKDSIKELKLEKSEHSSQSSSGHDVSSRPSAAQRLYRVLEEQALGEAIGRLSSASLKNKQQPQQPLNLCASDDIPIQQEQKQQQSQSGPSLEKNVKIICGDKTAKSSSGEKNIKSNSSAGDKNIKSNSNTEKNVKSNSSTEKSSKTE